MDDIIRKTGDVKLIVIVNDDDDDNDDSDSEIDYKPITEMISMHRSGSAFNSKHVFLLIFWH